MTGSEVRRATTNLLNRLEDLGYVVRTREHADRRIVTLRSGADIEGPAREFFSPFAEAFQDLVKQYPPEQLKQFDRFLQQLRGVHERSVRRATASPPKLTGETAPSRRD